LRHAEAAVGPDHSARGADASVRCGWANFPFALAAFNAGDLLMVSVLLRLKASPGILEDYPNLSTYVARDEARPA